MRILTKLASAVQLTTRLAARWQLVEALLKALHAMSQEVGAHGSHRVATPP